MTPVNLLTATLAAPSPELQIEFAIEKVAAIDVGVTRTCIRCISDVDGSVKRANRSFLYCC